MKFESPLIPGTLVSRYKRFLADVVLEDGTMLTVHCPNSGSMRGLKTPGMPVYVSKSPNQGRKLSHTLELVHDGTWVGINTQRPNKMVFDAVTQGAFPEFSGYTEVKREPACGSGTRLDLLLEGEGLTPCYVEVKNVTLKEGPTALFPDAVTARGLKHLETLADLKRQGFRAVLFFVIQRDDCDVFDVARAIDPDYAAAFDRVLTEGVEVVAYACQVSPVLIKFHKPLERRPDAPHNTR